MTSVVEVFATESDSVDFDFSILAAFLMDGFSQILLTKCLVFSCLCLKSKYVIPKGSFSKINTVVQWSSADINQCSR